MKKLILSLFFVVVFASGSNIGWDQNDMNIGWDQSDTTTGGGTPSLSVNYKSRDSGYTYYEIRCSTLTDTGAIIYLQDSTGGSWTSIDSSVWHDSGSHLDTLSYTGLTPATKYYYRLVALDSAAQGDTVAIDSISTATIVLSLTYKSRDSSSTSYSVRCSLYTDTGAIVRLYDSSGGSWSSVDSGGWFPQGDTLDTLTYTGLTPDTKYYYRMIAEDSAGQYDTVAIDSITTLPAAPNISVAATICTTDIFMDTVTISNSGGSVDSFIVLDALPSGIDYDTTAGKIYGTCDLIVSVPQVNYTIVAYGPGGNDTTEFTLTVRLNSQIWVDHRHVSAFDWIDTNYINLAKSQSLLLGWFGESHGRAFLYGFPKIDSIDGTGKYACKLFWDEFPTAAPDSLRVTSCRYRSNHTASYGGGEQHLWTSQDSIDDFDEHIKYYSDTLLDTMKMVAFGWCWDMTGPGVDGDTDWVYGTRWGGRCVGGPDGDTVAWGLDLEDTVQTGNHLNIQNYLDAMWFYDTNNTGTRSVYTTAPADNFANAEAGYQRYLKFLAIRAYVRANPDRIMFDDADILNYNNAGVQNLGTGWTDHNSVLQRFATISAVNDGDYDGGQGSCHYSDSGVIRLGKALWYLTARLAGWDGDTAAGTTQYQLTVSNDGNGTTDPSGAFLVDSGAGTEVAATPSAHYNFLAWETVSGTVLWDDSTTATAHCTLSVDNAEIQALFYPDTFYIANTITGTGTATITYKTDSIGIYGELDTLILEVTDGLANWPGGNNITGLDTLIVTVTEDSTVPVVTRSWPTYTVTVIDSPAAGGSSVVLHSPVDSAGADTSIATANSNYHFLWWVSSLDDTTTSGDTLLHSGIIANTVDTAFYGLDTFTVDTSYGANGTIETPLSDLTFAYGEYCTLIVIPDAGYWITGHPIYNDTLIWQVTGDSTVPAQTFYAKTQYNIDTSSGWGSNISSWTIDSVSTIDSGTVVHTIVVCEACSAFAGYTGDYTGSSASGSFALDSNMTIGASCEYGTCSSDAINRRKNPFKIWRSFRLW